MIRDIGHLPDDVHVYAPMTPQLTNGDDVASASAR